MFIAEMFTEAAQPQLVVIYPGRFQPFHLGHRDVFESLQAKYGRDNVFIATSNKTELPKSPFSFTDKTILMHAAGVPNDRILEVKSPYILPPQFDAANTIFVVAVGAPDADRLKPGSYKKDGSPSYYQKFEDLSKCQTADKHGYVIIAAERKKVITVNGQQYDASHGTENRALWNSIRDDAKARGEYLMQMYGRNDPEVGRILDKIPMNEDSISPHATDSASAIPGISEHIVKHGSQYRLVSKHGNKNLGTFPTKAAAEKHEREVQYFKHANENAVPQWTELGEELSMEDKMSIFESYYADGALLESEDHTVEYFTGLTRFSSDPVKNKKYMVTPLMLIQNKIFPLNNTLIQGTLVGKTGNQYIFVNNVGETIKFPTEHQGQQGLTSTFIFDNTKSYNDFRSELALKFNVELPEGSLNEFAPDGFNGGDDGEEFNPNLAKMAYDEGFVKGASLADGATTQRAMAINDWDKHDGGIYAQHFAKGFKAGRLDKINFNNKQYNLNLKLMKDGSIRHGEQGVAEARNTNPRVNEIRQLAKDFFGGNPYSSGTIGGGTVLRLSFHISGNLDGDYRYVPATQISPKDQQTLKSIKSKFEKFMASKGVSANEVSLKFHIGSGVYAGVRIAIPQEQGVAEGTLNEDIIGPNNKGEYYIIDSKEGEPDSKVAGPFSTWEEAIAANKQRKVKQEGVAEGFDKQAFRQHMKDLEAREELRKRDPVAAKALDLRGQLPQQSKKKPEDDSMSINDPRHPSYAYSQMGQTKIDEEAAGVGVVSNSQDPRYVMATTGDQNDVDASTLPKEMKAYGLIGRKLPKNKIKEAEHLLSRLTQLKEQLATLKAKK